MKTNLEYSRINTLGSGRVCTTISKCECDLSPTQRRKVTPAMSRAPSLLDSVPAASSPTKPTFSFFWSACAPGKTPPLRDFCTMMEACGNLLIWNHGDKATLTAQVDASVPAAVRACARAEKQIGWSAVSSLTSLTKKKLYLKCITMGNTCNNWQSRANQFWFFRLVRVS